MVLVFSQVEAEWNPVLTTSLDYPVFSICWNRDGTQLLTGGTAITLWEYTVPLPTIAIPSSEGDLPSKDDTLEDVAEEGEEGEGEEQEEGLVWGVKGKKSEEAEESGEEMEEGEGREEEEGDVKGTLNQLWRIDVPIPVRHLKFSPSAELFASCGEVSAPPPMCEHHTPFHAFVHI